MTGGWGVGWTGGCVKWKLNRKKRKELDSNGGGGVATSESPSRSTNGEMPLLFGTDIIFLVNYIISMWLKHSFNTTGKNSI